MKAKYYLWALLPVCVVGAVLRVFEILFAIESDTGFYVQSSVIPMVFNIFAVVVVLFYISALVLLKKEKKPINIRFAKITLIEKIAISLSAVGIFASSFFEFLKTLFPNGTAFSFENMVYVKGIYYSSSSNYTPVINLKPALSSLSMFMLIFSILVIIFTVAYIRRPKRTTINSFYKIISLSFTAYYVIRLFSIFVDSSTVLSRAYGSYTILFLSAVVLFFMNFSKMLIESPSKKLMLTFGFCAIFFGSIRLAEFIIMLIPNNPHCIDNNIFAYIADFTTVLAILSMVLRIVVRRQHRQPEISEAEPVKTAPVLIGDDEDVN